jgi:hypothetical protein
MEKELRDEESLNRLGRGGGGNGWRRS